VAEAGPPVRRNPNAMAVRATMIEPPHRASKRVARHDSSPRDGSDDAAHGIPLEKRRRRQAAPRIVECDVMTRFNFGDAAGSNNPAEGGAAPSQRSGLPPQDPDWLEESRHNRTPTTSSPTGVWFRC